MSATGTWDFAVKQGSIVKSDSKGGLAGSLAVGEPAAATFTAAGGSSPSTSLPIRLPSGPLNSCARRGRTTNVQRSSSDASALGSGPTD